MKFGAPTPDRTVAANGCTVGGAIMPPPGKIGLKKLLARHIPYDLATPLWYIRTSVRMMTASNGREEVN